MEVSSKVPSVGLAFLQKPVFSSYADFPSSFSVFVPTKVDARRLEDGGWCHRGQWMDVGDVRKGGNKPQTLDRVTQCKERRVPTQDCLNIVYREKMLVLGLL